MSDTQEPAPLHERADVDTQRVARVYAEALLNAATERGEETRVLEELHALHHDLRAVAPEGLGAFLASSAFGHETKANIIRSAFGGQASELILNFLLVLNDHDRLGLVGPVLAAYRELLDERNRRMRVQVRTAVPLPDDQRQRLEQELRQTFQQEPVLEAAVDPELLGGLVVRVGDWLYDASVRTRLNTLRNQIIESSSHEIQSGRDRFSLDQAN